VSTRRRGRPPGSGQKKDTFGKPPRAIYLVPAKMQSVAVTTFGVTRKVKVRLPREKAAWYEAHREDYRLTNLDLAWFCRSSIEGGARRIDVYRRLARRYGLRPSYLKRLHQRVAKAEGWPPGKAGRARKK
jgi:hypothetical protein